MTSRSYQKVSLSQMKGKTATEEEPPLGSNFNRWTDQHLQGKAIANTGSFRRDQPPTFLPTSAKHSALPKRKPGQPPELGTVFRWFKFTLKPPYRIANGNFFLAIWDTSHWNFLVKFGLKTAWDISYDILLSLLKFVNFWSLQGRLSILAKIGCLQKIKVFSMKERQGFDATWGF